MDFSEALAERIRHLLARQRASERKRCSAFGFLLHGNLCLGVWKGSLVVRLGPEQAEAALLGPHVSEFHLRGRAMKGWVLVGPEGVQDDERLARRIRRAVQFVGTLPAKEE